MRSHLIPWSLALSWAVAPCATSAAASGKLLDTILLQSSPEHSRFSEGSTICLDRKTELLMAVTVFGSGAHDNSAARILSFRSADGGMTWTSLERAGVLQANVGRETTMAPSLLKLAGGELLCFVNVTNSLEDGGPWVKRSSDNGATWSRLERLPYEGYGSLANDRAIQISTRRVLAPCWVSLDKLQSTRAYCFYSDDSGKTWRKSNILDTKAKSMGRPTSPAAEEPMVVELRDGRLLMILRTYLKWIYRSFSSDGGATWTVPENGGIPSPGSMATIERMPTGDLLLIWNRAPLEKIDGPWPRVFLSSAISRDDGRSWSSIRDLDGAADFQGKITMANVCFVGDDRAVVTYSKSLTKKNEYSWRLQVLPVSWFYEGDTKTVYGEPFIEKQGR